jgi:hypothetical protein
MDLPFAISKDNRIVTIKYNDENKQDDILDFTNVSFLTWEGVKYHLLSRLSARGIEDADLLCFYALLSPLITKEYDDEKNEIGDVHCVSDALSYLVNRAVDPMHSGFALFAMGLVDMVWSGVLMAHRHTGWSLNEYRYLSSFLDIVKMTVDNDFDEPRTRLDNFIFECCGYRGLVGEIRQYAYVLQRAQSNRYRLLEDKIQIGIVEAIFGGGKINAMSKRYIRVAVEMNLSKKEFDVQIPLVNNRSLFTANHTAALFLHCWSRMHTLIHRTNEAVTSKTQESESVSEMQ